MNDLLARLHLDSALQRIHAFDMITDITLGIWVPEDDFLLPAPNNTTRKEAWARVKRQMQTDGPSILKTKLAAVLGDVSWGGNSDSLDDALAGIDLRALARRLLRPYITHGMMAGVTTQVEGMMEPRITRLGGYLEGITDPDDVDTIVGIYQVIPVNTITAGGVTRAAGGTDAAFGTPGTTTRPENGIAYHVRVYHWGDSPPDRADLLEWNNLRNPTHLSRAPIETLGVQRPRFRILEQTPEGLPLGEMEVLTPQLMALWATEARMTLSEELSAFPMLKVMGEALGDDWAIGPGEPISLAEGSDAEWMEPGNLAELREQRDLRRERNRNDASLPGGFLGNDSPSGEAISEANIRFRQNISGYANDVQGILTELVADYATLVGVSEQPSVSVTPSKEYDAKERIESVIALFASGLLPLNVAAREIQVFFSTWSDDELNEWVVEQSAVVRPEDIVFPGDDDVPATG
jgi:hypothetical protein